MFSRWYEKLIETMGTRTRVIRIRIKIYSLIIQLANSVQLKCKKNESPKAKFCFLLISGLLVPMQYNSLVFNTKGNFLFASFRILKLLEFTYNVVYLYLLYNYSLVCDHKSETFQIYVPSSVDSGFV